MKVVCTVAWPMFKEDDFPHELYSYYDEAFVYKICVDGETTLGCPRGMNSMWATKALHFVKDTRPEGSESSIWLSDCPFSDGVQRIVEEDIIFET